MGRAIFDQQTLSSGWVRLFNLLMRLFNLLIKFGIEDMLQLVGGA
jgi:hypothetical protein